MPTFSPTSTENSSFVAPSINKWDHLSDARRRPPKSACVHRVGPAPREDILKDGENAADIGTLDSDMEDILESIPGTSKTKRLKKVAASKALVIYFSKMAKKGSKETVDFRFLDSLFQGGADVNVTDKHGQTVLHEVSRNWNTDVAKFFIEHGANVNLADKYGRSPLHLAAAVNHFDMAQYLLEKGADIHMKTVGELQSAIHYAAKYNAVEALKVLIENGSMLNDRDYKQRTPLFIAAEMAREESVRYLVDYGAPSGVYDDTGMSGIAMMVEKMPHIALDALNQFVVNDSAYRKDYFYLNFLEGNPKTWEEANQKVDEHGVPLQDLGKEKKKLKSQKKFLCPTTTLKIAVELNEFEVIMHPVMQQLIRQKWRLFGKWGALIAAMIHFTYIMIWTWSAIFLPRGQNGYYADGSFWKIPLEILGVLLTFYFILKQIVESKMSLRNQQQFRTWRTRQLSRDMDFCHPRWPQEKIFIQSEMKALRSKKKGLLSDPWNVFDLLTYIAVLIVIITRIIYVVENDELTEKIHLRAYTFALISMWLHFMKSCRPFTTLGPFITMLGHVMIDTLTFAFLFFEFFIPYTVGFWILFGGPVNGKIIRDAGEKSVDWELFNNLVFSVWQVTVNVDFNFDAVAVVDRLMAQIMVGSFFALSTVLCLNLYIALLSETFNRVYQNAKANASLLQANTILQIEGFLSKKREKRANDYIQEECGPLEAQQALDEAGVTEIEHWDKVVRNVVSRFNLFDDFFKEHFKQGTELVNVTPSQASYDREYEEELEAYKVYLQVMTRDKQLFDIKCQLYQLRCCALEYLGAPLPSAPKYTPPPVLHMHPPVRKIAEAVVGNRLQGNNEVFRSIMDGKKLESDDDSVDGDDALSKSWEQVHMLTTP